MPRGFLVKRYPNQLTTDTTSPSSQSVEHLPITTRQHYQYSDEDRSESSSSEPEANCVPIISSPLTISQSSHPLASIALSAPHLTYGNQYSKTELAQEVPLALIKSSFASDRKTPNIDDESPSALDLRCPSFIFHFPDRIPASAPSAYQRNLSALISCSPNNKPNTSLTTSKKRQSIESQKTVKRHKVVRKLNFDEHKSSPVSGTFIRDSDSEDDFTSHSSCVRRSGDIDPSLNVVVITDEARAEIQKIENKIGDYICALCKEKYMDAFGLAQHRCTRIVHVEYRCPECDKVFNCPANLASHRRWHKPKNVNTNSADSKKTKVSVVGTATIHTDANTSSNCSIETNSSAETTSAANHNQESRDGQYECDQCPKKFRRSAYLKKHLFALHNIDIENNRPEERETKKFAFVLKRKQKVFDFTNAIEKQKNKESIESDFKYRCFICNIAFNNEISLQMHNKSLHTNDSLSCRFCQRLAFNEAELALHVNEYHSSKDESILKTVHPLIKHELK